MPKWIDSRFLRVGIDSALVSSKQASKQSSTSRDPRNLYQSTFLPNFRYIGYSVDDLGFRRHLRRRAAAAARFGLLGNFLFLFRREFMNSTWSIGGALEQPASERASHPAAAAGLAGRTFAPFLPILNPFAMYVLRRTYMCVLSSRGKERRKEGEVCLAQIACVRDLRAVYYK